jgi:general secretion pathway protein E
VYVVGMGDDPDLASLADAVPEMEDLLEQSDAPVIKLINALLTEAIKEGASDIHIETFKSRLVARFRVDGVLREILSLKRDLSALLVSRIKVPAALSNNRSTTRSPLLEGRVDTRTSTSLPATRNEILPSCGIRFSAISIRKTTSLYAGLSSLNDTCRNILTVEDPIEYNLEGIGQTQVNTKVDMTFARGLRAILRQDPDVVSPSHVIG